MKSKQTKSWRHTFTFLNRKCSINQENLWKKQKNKIQLLMPGLSLLLGYSSGFVQSELEYSYKLYS